MSFLVFLLANQPWMDLKLSVIKFSCKQISLFLKNWFIYWNAQIFTLNKEFK